ncbi:uncharacterized protein PHACADRAFT_204088 [Phanerochaete carnosa HHB-10118-sp]|uniref:L-lactate dehydrogenase (cytochrome) n=1 Tax=Phanerochaete carnosa (strain HHB-10118-sp) TaxID=650164 RepID=K5VD92_PHACS|nr:uncharacterized protein PHACADRAFT_204088 [Phanerochaete carnosa HHB-10118-sp]EKM60941.1 hypothetical protein PHACADRAFT_204088 [Phanerochaete carnosa HHB-10118-sp]
MPISLKQVQEHNSKQSTPGGAKIILQYAGKDATEAYEPIHPRDALDKNLPPEKHLGELEASAAQDLDNARRNKKKSADEIRAEREQANKPPLSHIINLHDMAQVARKVLPYKAFAYFASASDDELTTHENARAFSRFFFHPRVLRPLSNCDPSTTILGYKSALPIFVSASGLAKLGHPDGEKNIARGAGRTGIIQMTRAEREQANKPPLSHIINLHDMAQVARKVLPYKAFAYFASASDDELTTHENARAFSRFFFHPRVLRPLSNCDPSTTILGYKSALPIFVSASGLAKLGHPDGEKNIARGAGRTGIIQMVSSNASLSYAEIAGARVAPDQVMFFQLYKNKNDDTAAKRVREVEQLGYKAIFLTVDAPFPGNRERDARAAWELKELERAAEAGEKGGSAEMPLTTKKLEQVEEDVDTGGTASAFLANDDVDMTWDKAGSFPTIPWLRSVTKMPILLKGVQCVQDAVLAAEAGVDGILLSNHGGRQMPYSLPPLEVLYRIRQQRPDLFDKMEIYIDGGITRGSDVLKAVCLGARAVGLGRPFLYAQSAYGTEGVVKVIRILEREIYMCMRLIGARTVDDLVPQMSRARRLDSTAADFD